jgi:hypothetical protein
MILWYDLKREVYTEFWWGNPREGDTLVRPRSSWEENIKMDLKERGCGGY